MFGKSLSWNHVAILYTSGLQSVAAAILSEAPMAIYTYTLTGNTPQYIGYRPGMHAIALLVMAYPAGRLFDACRSKKLLLQITMLPYTIVNAIDMYVFLRTRESLSTGSDFVHFWILVTSGVLRACPESFLIISTQAMLINLHEVGERMKVLTLRSQWNTCCSIGGHCLAILALYHNGQFAMKWSGQALVTLLCSATAIQGLAVFALPCVSDFPVDDRPAGHPNVRSQETDNSRDTHKPALFEICSEHSCLIGKLFAGEIFFSLLTFVYPFWPLYFMEELNIPTVLVQMIFLANELIYVLLASPILMLAQKWSRVQVILWLEAISCCALAGICVLDYVSRSTLREGDAHNNVQRESLMFSIAVLGLFTVRHVTRLLVSPLFNSINADLVPNHVRGQVSAISTAKRFVRYASGIAGGSIIHRFGYAPAFVFSTALQIIVLFLLYSPMTSAIRVLDARDGNAGTLL